MEEVIIGNTRIQHQNKRVLHFFIDGEEYQQKIRSGHNSISLEFQPGRPDICEVKLPAYYEPIIIRTFEVIDELYSRDEGCLAGFLSAHLFECFTPYWRALINEGKHILAIQFWQRLLSITHDWERKSGKHIHKGTPYAFIANTYLIIGDIDTGFSYIYNAIEDDILLNEVCPQLNYPNDAPVYLTASINPKPQNIMVLLVSEIRSKLQTHLDIYNSEFASSLLITDVDRLFLQNPNLETIKYFFVFTYWTIYEHQRKVNQNLMRNDFSKLKNSNWLFSICLIIDKLLQEHHTFTGQSIGTEIINYVISKGWMTRDEVNEIRDNENIQNGEPDTVLPRLLSLSVMLNGTKVRKEIQYLLIAWNLRNFAVHNIRVQNVIVDNFDDILNALMCDIFLIIEEYR